MCNEARKLFVECCEAHAITAASGESSSAYRVRAAIGMLANHNRYHRCCVTLRFEQSRAEQKWSFRLVLPVR